MILTDSSGTDTRVSFDIWAACRQCDGKAVYSVRSPRTQFENSNGPVPTMLSLFHSLPMSSNAFFDTMPAPRPSVPKNQVSQRGSKFSQRILTVSLSIASLAFEPKKPAQVPEPSVTDVCPEPSVVDRFGLVSLTDQATSSARSGPKPLWKSTPWRNFTST